MRKRLLGTCVLAFAIAASLTVSPASASPGPAASWSDSCGASGFSSLDRLAVSPTARGETTIREPELGQVATEVPASKRNRASQNFRVTVPTWVHVVSDGGIGNVSDRAIRDQIQVLNMTFGGFEGGVATGFSFDLAGITRTDNADWHYASISGERPMKRALHRGGDDTLNIYLTTAGPYLGWAYLPDVTEKGNAYLDGIVVDWESLRGVSDTYAGRYDQGETATHEAGHWLNLEHTFFGGCNAHGDFVADTPPERTPTSGCPADKDTCPDPGLDPIHNYMDYSYDTCYTEFTAGQAARMQDAWLFWRAS
jgi:hypothetical protein